MRLRLPSPSPALLLGLLLGSPLAAPACLPAPKVVEGTGSAAPEVAATPAPAPAPWRRLAVLGASASVGFGTELGRDDDQAIGLDQLLDLALLAEHEPPRLHATDLFFLNPTGWGELLIGQALEEEPSALVAIDYLFWFVYGGGKDEAQRLAELEQGLAWLGQFPGPLVIAEIPDMSAAVGKMLARSQLPAPKTLAAANRRIRAWAAARPATSVLVLAPRTGEGLIQDDQLHPTVRGLAELAIEALQALDPAGAADGDRVLADPAELERRAGG